MGILRFVLALSVVLWHMADHKFLLFHGGVAVIVFFIISGFYMTLVLTEKYSGLGEGWKQRFYWNRVLRLMPVYLVFCLLEILWYVLTNNPTVFTHDTQLNFQAITTLRFLNIFILGQDFWQIVIEHTKNSSMPELLGGIVQFFGEDAFNQTYILVGQAWTLSSEMLFYLIAPFIVLFPRRVYMVLALSLLLRIGMLANVSILPVDPWGYRFLPGTLVFFLLGSVSYRIYRAIASAKSHTTMRTIGWFIVSATTAFVTYNVARYNEVLIFDNNWQYDSWQLWGMYLVVTLAIPFFFLLSKRSKWDNLIGQLSYPMYIVHGLVIGIVFNLSGNPALNKEAFVVFLTVLFSLILIYTVEMPIERLRLEVSSRSKSDDHPCHRRQLSRKLGWITLGVAAYALSLKVCLNPQSTTTAQVAAAPAPSFEDNSSVQPKLVRVIENYNIVRFNQQFYAVEHGITVNWHTDPLGEMEGVFEFPSQIEAVRFVQDKLGIAASSEADGESAQ